jgi:hypothetical protein
VAFIVVYDACVLYPASLRDLLIRIATKGLLRAKWTDRILEECFGNILKDRLDLKVEDLRRTRELMIRHVPDCMVTGYEPLIDGLTLPDPNDRHVLAAAIRSGAQMIVTSNLRDFPQEALRPFGVEAQHPDDFVVNQISLNQGVVVGTILQQAQALKDPPHTPDEILDSLERSGLVTAATLLRTMLPR